MEGAHREHKAEHPHGKHGGGEHHAAMVRDFRKRFIVSMALTPPVILLSPMIQMLLGIAVPVLSRLKPCAVRLVNCDIPVWWVSVSCRFCQGDAEQNPRHDDACRRRNHRCLHL